MLYLNIGFSYTLSLDSLYTHDHIDFQCSGMLYIPYHTYISITVNIVK